MAEAGTKKKYLDKYDTEEEAAKGVAELEKKYGDQSNELGQLRAQVQQMQQVVTGYADYVKQADPIVKFYSENAPEIKTWFDSRGQNRPAGSNANGQITPNQAQQTAQQTAGYEWLSPQEKQTLAQEILYQVNTAHVAPWQQKWEGQAQQFATNLQNQNRAFTDVLWRTLERVIPPDKLAEARAWHEESLRFADPTKLDPMKVAGEFLGVRSENATLRARVAEFEKQNTEREKAAVPSFGSGSSSSLTADAPDAPKNKEERFQRVMSDLKTEHGTEGVHSMFPSLG